MLSSWHMGIKTIECGCGREVECYAFTNTCDCGREYNHAGQRLAPRSQWGEETGETAADIESGSDLDQYEL